MVTPSFNLTPTTTTTTTVITTVISAATTTAILCSLARDLIPESLQSYIKSRAKNLTKTLSTHFTVVIEEFNGITPNQMFELANVYLGTKFSSSSTTRRVRAVKSDKEREVSFVVDGDEEIVDFYDGVNFVWVMVVGLGSNFSKKKNKKNGGGNGLLKNEVRCFQVRFHKKYRDVVLSRYLRHVLSEAKKIKETKKEIKLHTVDYNGTDYWSSIILDHPATFDKIAMDPDAKKELIDDLELFISRKDYYRRVGKAWKRGYLLYGPPGTGKSSLVAAMANYLKFDVYDLDLKEVMCNSDLRRLLIGTASKSILVIEDIDCSIDLQNRTDNGDVTVDDEKVTLSGLLNFVDGLWSSCGDERIIVFTTNHKDRLDPALLRPGRMDVHIHMSYCTFSGFKLLATNYLGIQDHPLYNNIQKLVQHVEVTPAQIAGELMKRNDPTVALQGLVDFIQSLNKS